MVEPHPAPNFHSVLSKNTLQQPRDHGLLTQAESQVKDFSCGLGNHNLREYTAQIPILESGPHPHLTWRQEEESHGVSEKLIAAKGRSLHNTEKE